MLDKTTLTLEGRIHNPALNERIFCLSIAFHPDLDRIGDRVELPELESSSKAVTLSRYTPLFFSPTDMLRGVGGKPLEYPYVSRTPLRIVRNKDYICIKSEKQHALKINGVTSESFTIDINSLGAGVVIEISRCIVLSLHRSISCSKLPADHGLLGVSDSILNVRRSIDKIAKLNSNVLIRGESGTGKELVANAIHRSSSRAQNPFIAVNIPAIPETLAPAALFGSIKGAFTGSTVKQNGYFREAHTGTLFLDEIGETPDTIQTALLRVLESNEIQPVGASKTHKIDVRIVAATDAALEDKISQKAFRNPLFQRLSTFEIHIAPLRERREDIAILSLRGLELAYLKLDDKLNIRDDKQIIFLANLFARLIRFDWPGNARQLNHFLAQIVVNSYKEDHWIIPEHLDILLNFNHRDESKILEVSQDTKKAKPREVSNKALEETLKKHRWDIKSTADALNISRASLYKLIDEHSHIRRSRDIHNEELTETFKECRGDIELMIDQLKISKSAIKRRLSEIGITQKQKLKQEI